MSEVAKEVDSEVSPKKKARIENKEGQDGDLSSLKHNGNTDFEDVQVMTAEQKLFELQPKTKWINK